jgi:hypothetical protein
MASVYVYCFVCSVGERSLEVLCSWWQTGDQNTTTALVVLAIFCGMAMIFNILLLLM